MNVKIRLTRKLLDEMRQDLLRPHEFAAERVGFITAKIGNKFSESSLVLFSQYHSVADAHYIDDPNVGARIDSAAIRAAMQTVLDTKSGAFHVHLHDHRGKPGFSRTDKREIPNIISGLRVAGPKQPHGMFLLSRDDCFAQIWMPEKTDFVCAAKISVIGFPMKFFSEKKFDIRESEKI